MYYMILSDVYNNRDKLKSFYVNIIYRMDEKIEGKNNRIYLIKIDY